MTAIRSPWAIASELLYPTPNPFVNDAPGWVRAKLAEHLWSKQVLIFDALREHRRVAVKSCHGPGKALALDTPLATPTGWRTMGDVRVGDLLLDERGKACSVVETPAIETRPAYRVTFADRSSIVAADDHLWSVVDLRHRPRLVGDWRDHWVSTRVHSTEQLARRVSKGTQLRWRIPTTRALETAERWPLSTAPYAFGAWLGDGTTVRGDLTCHVDDAPHFAEHTGGAIKPIRGRPTVTTVQLTPHPYRDCPGHESGGKRIPAAALRATVEDRLALLQGLMDTDGCLADGAAVEIAICSERLVDEIQELVVSLGWVARRSSRPAKLNGRIVGQSHRVVFRPDRNPFRLPRKADEWARRMVGVGQSSRHTQRTIVSIDRVPDQPVRCVVVDSPSRLFLAGRAMVPTHNSWSAARIGTHWIDTHPKLEAFVVTSAPTDPQVKAILWREITRAHRKGKLEGRVTLDAQWKISDELVAFGRKPADIAGADETDTVTAFQGIHARFVLVIFDEASGIDRPLWIAANSLLTNEDARFLAIGNPDDPSSEFAKVCEGADPVEGGMSDRGWYVIPISIFDTPNFTGEEVPTELRPYLPSWTWLEENARDWGGDALVQEARRIADGGAVDDKSLAWTSPLFMSKALGQFPADAADGVVPWSWIRRCRGEEATRRIGPLRVPIELGVDVGASEASDRTVVRERQGQRAGRRWAVQSADPEIVAATVVAAVRESGATKLKVDSIGIGWALVAILRRDLPDVEVVGVNVAESASDPGRYLNLRSQIWWEVGRMLTKDGGWDLSELDERTLSELAAPRWHENSAGRIVIEPKDELRKPGRLGRSPDDADALLLAFYSPPKSNEARRIPTTDGRLTKGRRGGR